MFDVNYYKSERYQVLLLKKLREKMKDKKSIKTRVSMTENNKIVVVLPTMLVAAFIMVSIYFGLQVLAFLTYLFTN